MRCYIKLLVQLYLGQLIWPNFAVLSLNSLNSAVFTWVYQQHQSLCQHSINKAAHRL